MDKGNRNYRTDLINSFAWDTAILFIQKFEDEDYSTRKGLGGGTHGTKTGDLEDEVLKINDMAGNRWEWSTETYRDFDFPCVYRGGNFKYGENNSAHRYGSRTSNAHSLLSFRPILYL